MLTAVQVASRRAVTSGRTRRKRKRPVRPLRYPSGIATTYDSEVRRMLRETEAIAIEAIPELREVALRARQYRPDGRHLDNAAGDIAAILKRITARMAGIFNAERLATLAVLVGTRLETQHVTGFAAQMESLGVVESIDVLGAEPWLEDQLVAFARENVSLVKNISEQSAAKLEESVWRTVTQGERVEGLQAEVRTIWGASRKRSTLIARDQVGKLQGQLNQLRQVDAGFTEYEWSTSSDERVRSTHRPLHGTIQRWDAPPAGSRNNHPGGDYRCRCSAIPHLPEGDE